MPTPRHCSCRQPPCGGVTGGCLAAGAVSTSTGVVDAGTCGTVDEAGGAWIGALGTVDGFGNSPTGAGDAGVCCCDITPRFCCAGVRALWVAYQAMNRLMPKKTTASHLVLLDRK